MAADRGGIECVVFDVGGIFVRHAQNWPEAHTRVGFDPEHPVLASDEFMATRASLGLRHQRGEIEPEEYWTSVAAASGGAYSADDVARIVQAWLFDEYAGAEELIDDLLATGIDTASLSNTNATHWRRMFAIDGATPEFPTTSRLKYHAPSHEAGAVKPDAAIYQALEVATGRSSAALLFFDDRADNIDAARARGWHAELIDHRGDPPAEMRAVLQRYGVMA